LLLNKLLLIDLGEEFDFIRLVSIAATRDTARTGDSFVDNTTMGATPDDCNAEPTGKDVN
jgi:hypothetical protein